MLTPKKKPLRIAIDETLTCLSVAVAKLGAKVFVISKVGGLLEYFEWLQNIGLDLSGLKCSLRMSTTRFTLEYKEMASKTAIESAGCTYFAG
jgi:sugar/nucleoside kinase (ribokinase family)